MATAAPSRPSADAKLRGELSRAARSIRFADASGGLLALVALALLYAAVMVAVDKFAELPAWARGGGLGVTLAVAAVVGYFRVYRPLARAINPRFAARRVESVSPGAKNAVINWVDLENEQLGETVRAQLASRAATQVAAADAHKLAESRLTTSLMVACGVLVAVLAGLFLWLKPAPFLSLMTRAFNPFTVATIATRSEIVLDAPAGGDATILAGDPLPVRVGVNGRVPDATSPDRPRLLIRYTQDAATPEEYPLPAGAGPREFAADLPASVVQNGFWYAVAAGDARTPEYRVTVRPRPVITAYHVVVTPPAYTRLKPETATDPRVEALRGSEIALTVTGNRPLQTGQLRLSSQAVPVAAEPVPGEPGQLRFTMTARESGQYRVTFTTAEGETGDPTASQQLLVIADARPVVTVTTPSPEEVTIPVTGALAVDGLASDDFGVSAVALKLQLAGPRPQLLQALPYRGGKSLRRESDGSFPTRVEVKLSPVLSELKSLSGEPANVAEGAVIEYWLEAADNCTLPGANVGRSKSRRVKVGPPASPERQAAQNQQRAQRQGEEREHNQQQDQKFQNESRDKPQPNADQNPKPEQGSDAKPDQNHPQNDKTSDGSNGGNAATKPGEPQDGKPSADQNQTGKPPENGRKPDSKPGKPRAGGQPDQKPGDPQNGASAKPGAGEAQPEPKRANTGGESDPQPGAQSEQDQKIQDEARRVQEAANAAKNGKPQPGEKPSDAQRQELEQAARDLASGDKQKQQAARDTLDRTIGKENRENAEAQAEQIKKDLASSDPKTREAARKKVDDAVKEMNKQAGDKAANDASQAARDLNSPDANTRENAKQTLDKTVGPENREKLENQARQKSGAGGDAQKSDDLAKDAAEMARQQSSAAGQPDKAKRQQIQDAVKDLASNDPVKRDAAEKKLDDLVGKDNREAAQQKAEQLKNDLQSGDKETREKARQQVADMAKAMDDAKPKGGDSKPNADGDKPGGDPEGKQPGQKPATQQSGKPAGADDSQSDGGKPQETKPAEDRAKPGQSGQSTPQENKPNPKNQTQSNAGEQGVKSPGNQESAPQDGSQKGAPKAGDHSGGRDGQKPPGADKADPKLADKPGSGEGRRTVDPKDAPPGGQKPQGSPEDGQPGREQTAGEERPGQGTPPKPDAAKQQELADAADQLANGTPAEKQAARDKLDREIGQANREKAEADAKQLADDLQSGDPKRQAAAKEKLKDLKEKMAEQNAQTKPDGGQPGGQQPTPEQRADWEQKAKDLNSDDPAKKRAAEKAFDDAVGQDARQDLQQAQKDAQDGKPESRERARERAQKQIERAAKQPGKRNAPGGGGTERAGDKLVENEKNRLKTAELQLADLEKIKNDPALQRRVGYTPEQYESFLKGVREAVARQRESVAKLEDAVKKGAGPAALNVGGTRQVEARKGTTGGDAAGVGVPPEGFADALKRFGQEVNKTK